MSTLTAIEGAALGTTRPCVFCDQPTLAPVCEECLERDALLEEEAARKLRAAFDFSEEPLEVEHDETTPADEATVVAQHQDYVRYRVAEVRDLRTRFAYLCKEGPTTPELEALAERLDFIENEHFILEDPISCAFISAPTTDTACL